MRSLFIIAISVFIFSCSKELLDKTYSVDATAESAQQIADAMVSIDESGGTTTGDIARAEKLSDEKTFARLSQEEPLIKKTPLFSLVMPAAIADACSAHAYGVCSPTLFQKVRILTGCTTTGGGAMTGTVTLTFAGTGNATCTLPGATDSVTRVPSYDMTGLRGAVFAVAATSTGQKITRVNSTDFTFSSTGISRSFITPKAVKILDITTSTSAPITILGLSRNARALIGGGITVVNNLNSLSCTLNPSAVAWTANCNCPTAGNWAGTCTDATSMSVAFGSTCGRVTLTKGSDISTVTMDRCELN